MEKKSLKNKAEKTESVVNKSQELDKNATYTFVSNGKAPSMPSGTEYEVTGEMAQIFLDKNLGTLK